MTPSADQPTNTGLEQRQSRGGSQVQADHESGAADLRSLRRPPLIIFGQSRIRWCRVLSSVQSASTSFLSSCCW